MPRKCINKVSLTNSHDGLLESEVIAQDSVINEGRLVSAFTIPFFLIKPIDLAVLLQGCDNPL